MFTVTLIVTFAAAPIDSAEDLGRHPWTTKGSLVQLGQHYLYHPSTFCVEMFLKYSSSFSSYRDNTGSVQYYIKDQVASADELRSGIDPELHWRRFWSQTVIIHQQHPQALENTLEEGTKIKTYKRKLTKRKEKTKTVSCDPVRGRIILRIKGSSGKRGWINWVHASRRSLMAHAPRPTAHRVRTNLIDGCFLYTKSGNCLSW